MFFYSRRDRTSRVQEHPAVQRNTLTSQHFLHTRSGGHLSRLLQDRFVKPLTKRKETLHSCPSHHDHFIQRYNKTTFRSLVNYPDSLRIDGLRGDNTARLGRDPQQPPKKTPNDVLPSPAVPAGRSKGMFHFAASCVARSRRRKYMSSTSTRTTLMSSGTVQQSWEHDSRWLYSGVLPMPTI